MDKIQNNIQTIIQPIESVSYTVESVESSYQVRLSNYDLIVFCHLRWEFVFQRPQHIISRLAETRKVLFVEEPISFAENEEGTISTYKPNENITVLQPKMKWEDYLTEIVPIVNKVSHNLKLSTPIIWLYSANFYPVLEGLDHSLIIYDCMDELAAFKGASKSLIAFEKKLIKEADIVFTGGKSLYESKKRISENVFCFPSSVDHNHFEKSLVPETIIPEDIKQIPGPIVGFYGVIDERMDLKLLEKLAKSLPAVSFVVIGPVVKIDPNSLPKLTNLHYLGQKTYQELPNYLKAIAVAMMPFAMNEATRFISPTKTLEFMAALKPIVSTPIYDVKRDYSKVVTIAETAEEFSSAIVNYINESKSEKEDRIAKQKRVISNTSWDKTAKKMTLIMRETLEKKFSTKHKKVELSLGSSRVQISL